MNRARATAFASAVAILLGASTAGAEEGAQPFRITYDSWFGEDRYEPRFGRAAAEIGGLMALGLVYYWQDPLANKEDWDNPSIEDRATFRALRFDTNLNTTNHLLHPAAGALVYGTARVNGLPIPASFAYGVAQSTLWELALEWREKASINDLVFTAVGGVPLGEAFYQLGEYLNSAPGGGGFLQKAAAWTLGFPRRIHRAIDGDDLTPVPLPPDRLGFSSAFGHRFDLAYEGAALSNELGAEGTMHTGRLDMELAAMPGFLGPGSFSTGFVQGNFTELHVRVGVGDTGVIESDLQARSTLVGHYAQDFSLSEDGDPEGHAAMIGIGPALRFQSSQWLGREDQLSTVHLPGPQADVWLRDADLAARFGIEAYADFAAIESLAFPAFARRYGADGTKSVLQRQGYAFSLGVWTRVRGGIAVGPVAFTGSVGYGRYGSIDELDRFQESITQNVHGTEEVIELEAAASVRVLGFLNLGAGIRERRRASSLADVSVSRRDRDLHLGMGVSF